MSIIHVCILVLVISEEAKELVQRFNEEVTKKTQIQNERPPSLLK